MTIDGNLTLVHIYLEMGVVNRVAFLVKFVLGHPASLRKGASGLVKLSPPHRRAFPSIGPQRVVASLDADVLLSI